MTDDKPILWLEDEMATVVPGSGKSDLMAEWLAEWERWDAMSPLGKAWTVLHHLPLALFIRADERIQAIRKIHSRGLRQSLNDHFQARIWVIICAEAFEASVYEPHQRHTRSNETHLRRAGMAVCVLSGLLPTNWRLAVDLVNNRRAVSTEALSASFVWRAIVYGDGFNVPREKITCPECGRPDRSLTTTGKIVKHDDPSKQVQGHPFGTPCAASGQRPEDYPHVDLQGETRFVV